MDWIMGKKYFSLSILVFMLLGILGGCGQSGTTSPVNAGDFDQFYASSADDLGKDHSIYINKEDRLVKVYATVNGKYLKKPTRHGLNWVEGSNGDKSVFKAYASPLAFYHSLRKIGGDPALEKGGDKDKAFNKTSDGEFIKGDKVEVKITWDGADKTYDIHEVMMDSTGKKIVYHFGGNYEAAKEHMTGCFMCFDSCPVGITSNASHPVGTFKDGKAKFHGNPDVLPGDGTPVVLIYQFVKTE
ncbi:YdjY domain-containing protein [Halobacillus naozhouensis]|uniref:YdjY domain-containing protein n=1 Tax=Halobacillus naozhouensis TaxID=554880 RepID=A0ABY8IW80_9BACI|nr:YdjY domain-containing protein [Halobacillus naozhouensis]WFT74474.1 YdjY domain-containing protein [Halobacillus naozhouensis]